MTPRLVVVTSWVLFSGSALVLPGCNRDGEARAELGHASATAEPQVIAREQVPTVTVEQVERPELVQVAGSLEADEDSDVASKRGGIIRAVKVERGTVVNAGDVLLVLDHMDEKNALAEGIAQSSELAVRLGIDKDNSTSFSVDQQPDVKAARSRLELAEANFRRDAELFEKKVIPRGDYDTSRNNYETARLGYQSAVQQASQLYQAYQTALTRVQTLRQNLEDMIVRAPFDGIIAERHVAVGESLQVGEKVATLVRIDPLRLVLTLPEQQVSLVQQGQTVRFRVGALPGEQFEGRVRYVGPSLQPTDRTLLVEALVPNKDHQLRPGYFAEAELELPRSTTALLVPAAAVKREGESARLFVLEEGRAREKVVTIGRTLRNKVEVTSGLTGREIVVADAARVHDGVLVR